jgi:ureidoglycolate lyase
MTTTIDIPVEPLTEAAFAPFGQIIGVQDGAPLFSAPGVKTWGVDFAIDGTLEIHYARFDHTDSMAFAKMERHFNVTQAFLPLDGNPSVKVFAAPTDPDPSAIPGRDDLRAFYLDGGQGVMMWKGTWHSDILPTQPPNGAVAMITAAETTVEMAAMAAGGRLEGKLTQIVDFAKKFGQTFRISDPNGLIAG